MNSGSPNQSNAEQDFWAVLDDWEPEPVSMDFNRQLFGRIQNLEQQRKLRWRSPWIPAIFGLFFVILLLGGVDVEDAGASRRTAISNQKLELQSVQSGQAVAQTLSDLNMFRAINSSVISD